MGAVGICGSDVHYYFDGRNGPFPVREPFTPGHEASGVIEALGEGVDTLKVGSKAAIHPGLPCGVCPACRAGQENLCGSGIFYGSAARFPHLVGFFRDAIIVAARQVVPVPEDSPATLAELAVSEPLAVALHALKRAGSVLGRRVLVTGAGPIGLLVVAAARAGGAQEVSVTDLSPAALERAAKFTDDFLVNAADDQGFFAARQKDFDIVLEASGSPKALETGISCTRSGGTVVQVGTLPPKSELPTQEILFREITYLGCQRFTGEFMDAVALIAKRRIDVRPIVTHSLPLDQADAAFVLARDPDRSAKVQLAGLA
jgi:L-idonate 5-dehydrogenase